jgi:hypothetical protein
MFTVELTDEVAVAPALYQPCPVGLVPVGEFTVK